MGSFISWVTIIITRSKEPITPPITTHEPPSKVLYRFKLTNQGLGFTVLGFRVWGSGFRV